MKNINENTKKYFNARIYTKNNIFVSLYLLIRGVLHMNKSFYDWIKVEIPLTIHMEWFLVRC